MQYKINEIFYSLKGEGRYTGTPMTFIRLSGCSVGCSFCDTPDTHPKEMYVGEIIEEISKYPSNRIVITGGEPLDQDLFELLCSLDTLRYKIHLETSGYDQHNQFERIERFFKWIALSPKEKPVSQDILEAANEVKFLCGSKNWKGVIEKYADRTYGVLMLMPLAHSKHKPSDRSQDELIEKNVKMAIEYCLKNPKLSLCIQAHKYLGIK